MNGGFKPIFMVISKVFMDLPVYYTALSVINAHFAPAVIGR